MCFPSLWNTPVWQAGSQPKTQAAGGAVPESLAGVHQQVLSGL